MGQGPRSSWRYTPNGIRAENGDLVCDAPDPLECAHLDCNVGRPVTLHEHEEALYSQGYANGESSAYADVNFALDDDVDFDGSKQQPLDRVRELVAFYLDHKDCPRRTEGD